MAYNVRKLADLLLKLPEEAIIKGWDDGGLYVMINDEEWKIENNSYKLWRHNWKDGVVTYDI